METRDGTEPGEATQACRREFVHGRRRLRDHHAWRGGCLRIVESRLPARFGVWRIEVAGTEEYLSFASDVRINMMRFLFRLLSLFALSVAVIMAVLDATRSIAGSALIMTPLATSWAAVSADTLASVREMIETKLHRLVWDLMVAPVLSLPGFIVFAALAFLFFSIGRRPQRPARHLAM